MVQQVPRELEFHDMRADSKKVIIKKEMRSILPQNGTSFSMANQSAGTQIIIRLPSDSNCCVDLSSLELAFDLQITGIDGNLTATNTLANLRGYSVNTANAFPILAFNDSIESIFNRIALYINGSEAERHDYYNTTESSFNNWFNSATWANSIGSGAMGMNLDVIDRTKLLLLGVVDAATSSNTLQFSVPLRWLGVSSLSSLFPMYLLNTNQFEIRIFLDSTVNSLVQGTLTAPGTAGNAYNPTLWTPSTVTSTQVVLSNVRCNVNYVNVTEEYSSALTDFLTSNNLSLPIVTNYETQVQIPAGQSSWFNATVSAAFSDIESVFVFFQRASEQNSFGYAGTDRLWFPEYLKEARLMINGVPTPQVPIQFDDGNVVNLTATANNISALNGSYGNMSGESLSYLVKALQNHNGAEIVTPYNHNFTTSGQMRTLDGGAGVYGSLIPRSGNGMFYSNNKQIYNCQATSATAFTGLSDPLRNQEIFFKSPSSFMIGFDCTKSNYADVFDINGTSLNNSSGLVQVQLRFGNATLYQYNMTVVIRHKRIIELSQSNSEIIY